MTQTLHRVEPELSTPRVLASDRFRLGTILLSHTAVDVYAAFVAPILGVLELRANLTPAQAAWLLGIGSLSSGLCQPLSAWLGDRLDSRLFGALGLIVAAVCLSAIGAARDFTSLALLFGIGMAGVGVFHPVGASSIGNLAERVLRGGRSLGISVFFVAGMVGGVAGSIIASRLVGLPNGFTLLAMTMIPGLALGVALHASIRRVPHRHVEYRSIRFDRGQIAQRWLMVGCLEQSVLIRSGSRSD